MNRVDEKRAQELVLIVLSDLLKLLSLYLPYRLILVVNLFISAVQFVKLLRIVGVGLHLVPPLHLALCLIDKECSEKDPEHEGDECCLDHGLYVCRVEVVDVDDVEDRDYEHHIRALPH